MFKYKKFRENDLYYCLQVLISEKTGFLRQKIKLIEARKVKNSQLNYFIFEYKKKIYHLFNDRLTEYNSNF